MVDVKITVDFTKEEIKKLKESKISITDAKKRIKNFVDWNETFDEVLYYN